MSVSRLRLRFAVDAVAVGVAMWGGAPPARRPSAAVTATAAAPSRSRGPTRTRSAEGLGAAFTADGSGVDVIVAADDAAAVAVLCAGAGAFTCALGASRPATAAAAALVGDAREAGAAAAAAAAAGAADAVDGAEAGAASRPLAAAMCVAVGLVGSCGRRGRGRSPSIAARTASDVAAGSGGSARSRSALRSQPMSTAMALQGMSMAIDSGVVLPAHTHSSLWNGSGGSPARTNVLVDPTATPPSALNSAPNRSRSLGFTFLCTYKPKRWNSRSPPPPLERATVAATLVAVVTRALDAPALAIGRAAVAPALFVGAAVAARALPRAGGAVRVAAALWRAEIESGCSPWPSAWGWPTPRAHPAAAPRALPPAADAAPFTLSGMARSPAPAQAWAGVSALPPVWSCAMSCAARGRPNGRWGACTRGGTGRS